MIRFYTVFLPAGRDIKEGVYREDKIGRRQLLRIS